MPRKESEESVRVKEFLSEYPDATYKSYKAKYPDATIVGGYFSIIKGKLKDPDKKEAKVDKPVKVKAEKKASAEKVEKAEKVAEPRTASFLKTKKAGNGESKPKKVKISKEVISDHKKFRGWIEQGISEGYIANMKDFL